MFATLFNDIHSSEDTVGAWPLSLKDNQTAIPSKALGFGVRTRRNVKTRSWPRCRRPSSNTATR